MPHNTLIYDLLLQYRTAAVPRTCSEHGQPEPTENVLIYLIWKECFFHGILQKVAQALQMVVLDFVQSCLRLFVESPSCYAERSTGRFKTRQKGCETGFLFFDNGLFGTSMPLHE